MPGCALWLVQVSGPGSGRTLARRGRPPGRRGGGGRGGGRTWGGDYLHTSDIINGGSPYLPAMSPQVNPFVGDIGIVSAVIDPGPLAWADISEVINLNN